MVEEKNTPEYLCLCLLIGKEDRRGCVCVCVCMEKADTIDGKDDVVWKALVVVAVLLVLTIAARTVIHTWDQQRLQLEDEKEVDVESTETETDRCFQKTLLVVFGNRKSRMDCNYSVSNSNSVRTVCMKWNLRVKRKTKEGQFEWASHHNGSHPIRSQHH